MLKHSIRWIIPVLALLIIATAVVFSVPMFTHAAAPTSPAHTISTPTTTPNTTDPNIFWHG